MNWGSHCRLRSIPSLIVCGLALSACGGGGGVSVPPGPPPSLQLLAGSVGDAGSLDATGAVARFRSPYGLATDANGNVYVADFGNNTIRKITSAAVVTTLAGAAGVVGSADGNAGAASFHGPWGIATDNAGNVYVADSANGTIRKITSAGVVTTLAGTPGVFGSADGTGPEARFVSPEGVATDDAGNVFVADTGNNTIRKVTSAGVVTTLAGTAGVVGSADGTGGAASFSGPTGIASDSSGNLYVADYANCIIRKITPDGVVTTLAGAGVAGSDDGMGTAARFYGPTSVATDNAGDVYVADWYDNAIRTITPDGMVTHLAGGSVLEPGSANGTGAVARFWGPMGVAADTGGRVYVADEFNNEIREISPDGLVTNFAGTAGVIGSADGAGPAASFAAPAGVATDSVGNAYVADTGNKTIRKVTSAGVVTTLWTLDCCQPMGVGVDADGNVYVADDWDNTIWKVTPAGAASVLAGSRGPCPYPCERPPGGSADGIGTAASFRWPTGVAIDLANNVYVADWGNNTIRKITQAGVVTTVAGTAGATGGADGIGAGATFNSPWGVATDSAGNAYVTDSGNNTIRKVTPTGVVTTLAGTAGVSGSADGMGASASFRQPLGIAIDSAGNIYVADSGNDTIRMIRPDGLVSTLVGQPGMSSFSPGPLPGLLASPVGVASFGTTLYITMVNAIVEVSNVPEIQ